MSFNVDDYVDVAARITLFYEKFPEGRLTRLGDPVVLEVGPKLFIMYTAQAYRTPDDPIPGVGTAWEPFPGPTQFTRDSELMNAETAAWGRAIIAAGIGSKKIASVEEVRNRQPDPRPAPVTDVPADDVWWHGTIKPLLAQVKPTWAQIREAVEVAQEGQLDITDATVAITRLSLEQRKVFETWLVQQASAGTPVA